MCDIWDLGVVEYREAWELQRRLHHQRVEGKIPDLLLLLEHSPTITIGRSGSLDNVLISTSKWLRPDSPFFSLIEEAMLPIMVLVSS